LKVTFVTDLNGEIASLSMPLEGHVKPIVFERTAEAQMYQRTFLERFTGDYDLPASTLTVSLQGDSKLVLSRPGSPVLEMRPKHGQAFEVPALPGQIFEFRDRELVNFTPDGVYVYKKK